MKVRLDVKTLAVLWNKAEQVLMRWFLATSDSTRITTGISFKFQGSKYVNKHGGT